MSEVDAVLLLRRHGAVLPRDRSMTMATFITHIRVNPPHMNDHEHITHLRWEQSDKTGNSTRQGMVDFIRKGNRVWVHGSPDAEVGVVDGNPPYVRTHADGYWNNNLLSLPRF